MKFSQRSGRASCRSLLRSWLGIHGNKVSFLEFFFFLFFLFFLLFFYFTLLWLQHEPGPAYVRTRWAFSAWQWHTWLLPTSALPQAGRVNLVRNSSNSGILLKHSFISFMGCMGEQPLIPAQFPLYGADISQKSYGNFMAKPCLEPGLNNSPCLLVFLFVRDYS